jgi:ATP-dependent Lon protease
VLLHDLKREAMLRPDDAGARFDLGEALFGDKQFEAAIKQLEKALALDPDHANARRMLARAYRAEGRNTPAERAWEELVKRRPEDAGARDELSELLVEGRRLDDAILHLEEAIKVDPTSVSRLLRTADLARQRGLLPRARGHLEKAQKLAPEDPEVTARLAEIALELGSVGSIITSPLHRGREFLLGRARAALAAPPFEEALTTDTLRDAAARLRSMDVSGAKRALVTASPAEQESAGFLLLRAEMTLLEGDLEKSEKAYRRCVARAPGSVLAWSRLGEVLAARGRLDEAARCYEQHLTLVPDDAGALEALGDTLSAQDRPREAMEAYQKALKLQADPMIAAKVAELRSAARRAEDDARPIGRLGALGWNAMGGVVSPLEAVAVPGKGELIFTGPVGKSGQDAAKVAFSCLKARAESLGIEEAVRTLDLHLHFIDTEHPKDGPSAGLALALAGLSAYTRRPLKPRLAATGEITLQGGVRSVGGLHEKLVAARLAGVETVIVPRKNLFDLRELSRDVLDRISLVHVDSLPEALEHALLPGG